MVEKINLDKFIAKLYIYMLPIHMIAQLDWLTNYFHGAVIFFDVILHFIGLVTIVVRGNSKFLHFLLPVGSLIKQTFLSVCILNISSFLMACLTQFIVGDYAGESAFSGIIGMVVYYIQYALMFYYNACIFKLFRKDELLKILNRICNFLMVLGYLQIIAILYPSFKQLLLKIDLFRVLFVKPNMWKLSLTMTEGAAAGVLISTFVMPIILGQIVERRSISKYNLCRLLLWLPIIYFTKSTIAYASFALCLVVFFYFITINKHDYIRAVGLICLLLFLGGLFLTAEVGRNISYLLFHKVFDLKNGSTVTRMVPLFLNLGAFCKSPFWGVGNGLQGYYFQDTFPLWLLDVAGSDVGIVYAVSTSQISNGGSFLLGYISGYGLFGIFIMFIFIRKIHRIMKKDKDKFGVFYYIFYISLAGVLVCGISGDFVGTYFVFFILSIPFMENRDIPLAKFNN